MVDLDAERRMQRERVLVQAAKNLLAEMACAAFSIPIPDTNLYIIVSKQKEIRK